MKIEDVSKRAQENPYNMNLAADIWQYKGYILSSIGGIILPVPKPTPRSFSVFGITNLALEPGDMVMVARNCSNNPTYSQRPLIERDENGLMVERPAIQMLETIKDGCVGIIDSIQGNRITLKRDLTIDGSFSVGWPKAHGAVTKILSRDNTLISEKLTDNVNKAKKLYGGNWKQKADNGVWLK